MVPWFRSYLCFLSLYLPYTLWVFLVLGHNTVKSSDNYDDFYTNNLMNLFIMLPCVYLSTFICLSAYLVIYLYICLSIFSVWIPFRLIVYISIYLSICLTRYITYRFVFVPNLVKSPVGLIAIDRQILWFAQAGCH